MINTTVRRINVFISSPSDVQKERNEIKEVIAWLNTLSIIRESFTLIPLAYEDTVPPVVGDVPQRVVNRHLVKPDECDVLICVLWNRFGTEFIDPESNRVYPSGTYYEFEKAYDANQRTGHPVILLYRKIATIQLDGIDEAQLQQVEDFFQKFHKGNLDGLYRRFNKSEDFPNLVRHNLLEVLKEHFGLNLGSADRFLAAGLSRYSSEELLSRFRAENARLRLYPSTIGGRYSITRKETQEILSWLDSPEAEKRLALLIDKPGTGKTVVMAQVLQALEGQGVPVLALKADYFSGIQTESELQSRLHLPIALEDCIRVVAAHQKLIILIDQLDALSVSLSQDFKTLDLFYCLILALIDIPNVRLIVSCREFDLNHDPQLSFLKRAEYKRVVLGTLSDEQVEQALVAVDIQNIHRLSRKMCQLLALPLHLTIYVDMLAIEGMMQVSEEYHTLQQLYDRLWDLRVSQGPALTAEVIYRLTHRMAQDRRLSVPVGVLDAVDYRVVKNYLQTINLIRDEGGRYVFFHQTFFDYCYARQFIAAGNSIAETVLSGSQGFFERAQILQVLAYLRDLDADAFEHEFRRLLFAEQLRRHLRFLLIEWFSALTDLLPFEKSVALQLLRNKQTEAAFLNAAHRNPTWLDELGSEYFEALLRQERTRNLASDYLASVIALRTQDVISLLKRFAGQSDEWVRLVLHCLFYLNDWSAIEAVNLFIDILPRDRTAYRIDHILFSLAATNPEQCCRALGVLFDSDLQEWVELQSCKAAYDSDDETYTAFANSSRYGFKGLLGGNDLAESIQQVAITTPMAFTRNLFPKFVKAALLSTNPNPDDDEYNSDHLFWYAIAEFQSPLNVPSGVRRSSFVEAMVHAVQEVAKTASNVFREMVSEVENLNSDTVHFFIAFGYLANPHEFVSDIYRYLTGDRRRFRIGDRNFYSAQLVRIVFEHGTPQERAALEMAILNYVPRREKDPRAKAWRYTQASLLRRIPKSFLSSNAQRRLQELERRFGLGYFTSYQGIIAGFVTSPLNAQQIDKMSDAQLLAAMRHFSHPVVRKRTFERFLTGGFEQLQSQISIQAKDNAERFFRLTQHFDDTLIEKYGVAILEGLTASEATSLEWIFELARRCMVLVKGEHRIGFARALERTIDKDLPNDLLDVLSDWARFDPDPALSHDEEAVVQQRHSWLNVGINTVRGVALDVACKGALHRTPRQITRVTELLSNAVGDPSTGVGATALHAALPLLDLEREQALKICEMLLDTHLGLLDDEFTYSFLSWASFYYFERFRRFLGRMINSEIEHTRHEGARLICQAALFNKQATKMAQLVIKGDTVLRRGASMLYARYVGTPDFGTQCTEPLSTLAYDDDEQVRRNVSGSFAHLRPELHFYLFRSFIDNFVMSASIITTRRHFIHFALGVAISEPEFCLQVTERLVSAVKNKEIASTSLEGEIVVLPLTVYNRGSDANLKEQAITLFEDLLEIGVPSAHEALRKWDEHRKLLD